MSKLKGKNIKKKYIELQGQHGEFKIDNKEIKVRYFSTFASSRDKHHDSYTLLEELRPMRERVKAKEISNLNSLLQRDLNDFRVANELIPYLASEQPPVAFFPAILAILMPKGFIAQNKLAYYPTPKRINEEPYPTISYEDLWKLDIFKIEDEETTLGNLSIDSNEVDIVVLDGQHRANAFRVVSGTFEGENNTIYSSFYKNTPSIKNLNADLPVTIIWFDNKNPKFDPKIVSRKLFVDVNNSAKRVSRSRTILLDEYEVPSLLTRFFYSELADKRQFTTDKFSLFHADFDLDSDINVSSNNVFSLTNPQILYDLFSWITLGRNERYNDLSRYSVGRESFRNSETTFSYIFDTETFNDKDILSDNDYSTTKRVVVKDINKIDDFEKAYKEILSSSFMAIFTRFIFYKNHFIAADKIEKNYIEEMDHTEMAVWENIFLGGEGLYYTFKDKNLRQKGSRNLDKYVKAIDKIENEFRKERAELFDIVDKKNVDKAFNSANSKAFQIGLFMALEVYRDGYSFDDTYEDFLKLLNKKSENDWIYILTDIRQKIIKGTDPKKWPAYQNIILRSIQDEANIFYDSENFLESPDANIFENNIKSSFDSWLDINEEIDYEDLDIETIGEKDVKAWINNAKNITEELFAKANVKPIENVNYFEVGKTMLNKYINKVAG